MKTIFSNKKYPSESNPTFAFVKSENIQVYPCGRRRYVQEDDVNIPFDPEARLNTEANNRRLAGTNGYTQTYVGDNWSSDSLMISLAGYQFSIGATLSDFIDDLNNHIDITNEDVKNIYANIRIQDILLFSGSEKIKDYYTGILRDQTGGKLPETYLDIPDDNSGFYFSGLSFSTAPLAETVEYQDDEATQEHYDYKSLDNYMYSPLNSGSWVGRTCYVINSKGQRTLYQQVISLCILEKVKDETSGSWTWRVFQPSLLPQIVHGETEGSIKVTGISVEQAISTDGDIQARTINAKDSLTYGESETPVVMLEPVEIHDDNGDIKCYQLQFTFTKK
jgi:hypothetical protein